MRSNIEEKLQRSMKMLQQVAMQYIIVHLFAGKNSSETKSKALEVKVRFYRLHQCSSNRSQNRRTAKENSFQHIPSIIIFLCYAQPWITKLWVVLHTEMDRMSRLSPRHFQLIWETGSFKRSLEKTRRKILRILAASLEKTRPLYQKRVE